MCECKDMNIVYTAVENKECKTATPSITVS